MITIIIFERIKKCSKTVVSGKQFSLRFVQGKIIPLRSSFFLT